MPRMMTQPERVEYMLKSLKMSAAKFARECHLTEATVSRWRSNSCKISQSCAEQIEDRFPQFATQWILGTTRFLNESAEAFSGSLYRTHPKLDIARQILNACGYSMETPFDRSSTVLDASTALLDLANEDMSLTFIRRESGTSFEVPLQHVDSWITEVIGYAAESFAKMLASVEDGTIPQPKLAQWVQVDPESFKEGVHIGKKRQ